jgi:4-hydroxy-tetrahydrodipicolinate synthase
VAAVDFAGSMVAIVTPFRDGAVDVDAFGALVEWHLASGTAAIVVSGTTGEAATLRMEEREALCRRAVEICKGRCPVVAGTGTNATWSTVESTRAAVGWGVDGLLVVTPYYVKPTQAGLLAHFEEVARAAGGCPIIAYDVPGRTGVTIAEETCHRLARIPGVVALKDATHDVERAARLAHETPLTILSGDDALTLPLMRGGARGVISVTANIVPDRMARLCAEQDAALHEQLVPLFQALFVESNPIPLKFALAETGRIRNELRLPLVPLSAEHEPTVRGVLQAMDVPGC